MKHKSCSTLKLLYVLSVLSLFLPWFTYNASIMGYCRGIEFLPFFLIPFCIFAFFLFKFRGSTLWGVLCQASALADVGILVYILGFWQKHHNIRDGFQLTDGLHTAQAGFWLAVGLHTTFLILLTVSLLGKRETGEVSE